MNSFKEKALFISGNDDLRACQHYDRIYFGHESCERLLPTRDTIKKMFDKLSFKKDLKWTFVTPLLTDAKFSYLKEILEMFIEDKREIEIVVNDFGTLRFINKYYNYFNLICGRILSQFACPSIFTFKKLLLLYMGIKKTHLFIHSPKNSYFKPPFFEWLHQLGIGRLEMNDLDDALRYGNDLKKFNFRLSFYFPYSYITLTRYCFFDKPYKSSNRYCLLDCQKDCRGKYAELKTHIFPAEFIIKDNAIYLKEKRSPNICNNNADRLVIHNL